MAIYSQKDPRWANIKIGNTNLTIGNFGCYMVDLAMLANIPPNEVNALFTKKKAYNENGEIINERAYNLLGMTFLGKSTVRPAELCIATTCFYAPKFPRHFFIMRPGGQKIVDPLVGAEIWNKYKGTIVSYRLFKYGN